MGAQGKFSQAVFLAIAFFVTSDLMAQEISDENPKPDIDTIKSKLIESIDRHIKILDAEENCIDSARSVAEIRDCRKGARQETQKLMEEYKGMGGGRMDERRGSR